MCTATGLFFLSLLSLQWSLFPLGAFLSLEYSAAEWKRVLCLIRRNVYQFECDFLALQETQKGILTFTLCEELDNTCWEQNSFLMSEARGGLTCEMLGVVLSGGVDGLSPTWIPLLPL